MLEAVEYRLCRLLCLVGHHNWSCRGRRDHIRADGSVIA